MQREERNHFTTLTVSGLNFSTIMRMDPILIRPPSSKATPCPDPKGFIIFPTFWIAVTMDTHGRKGAGSADMNRAAKMHLRCGRHGSRVHLTHLLRSRLLLSKKCVVSWPLNAFSTLKMTMWSMWLFPRQVTSSMTSSTCSSTRNWATPGSFCFTMWW